MNFGITYKPPSPTPINILWAETYYDLVDYGENKNSDIIWKSKSYKLPYLNAFLRFQYQQLTNKHIRLTCARIVPLGPNSRLDYRYTLQFHCSITLDDTDPLVFHMLGTQTEADGSFHLKCDCNCNQFDSKIVVSVIEHEIFKTDVYFRQEKDFREMKEQYFNSETVLNYFGCILNCPRVQDIFTGRQDYEFSELKSNYIKRTARFAKDIADYLRRRDTYVWMPEDWSFLLNYILNGVEAAPISNKDLIKGYHQGCQLGLKFLSGLSRDTIVKRFGDRNFVIEALQAADIVNDQVLFCAAAYAFRSWEEIFNSEKWLKMSQDSPVKCQFIIYALKRLEKLLASRRPVQTVRPRASNFL